MSYVAHNSAGGNGAIDVAVSIGTGTSRKAVAFFAHDNGADELAGAGVYDPAGTNVALTVPTGGNQGVLNSGDAFYLLDCFYYDIPDGQSGSKTFRFTAASGSIRGAAGVVVYDGMASGAPEAFEPVEFTGGATSLSDSITTLSANAVIFGGAMLGGASMTGAQFTPTNGQTERADLVGDEYTALAVGVLEKATAGAQTFGSTFASRPVGIQILAAFAPAGGDSTAPTLSSPSASSTGSTTGSGSVESNEGNGTLYFVVTTSSTSPSAAQVQAGQDHTGAAADDSGSQAVSGTGAQSITGGFSGLTASTAYYAHYQHQDAATNDSTVASSSSFTTDAEGSFQSAWAIGSNVIIYG